jgi:SSS family transporter
MSVVDWLVVLAYLVWIVYDGLKRSKATDEVEGYFLANRSLPWWAVGLSVMATQLSAITLVGTTGQAYADGMRFIQFYFGLPLAMIILSVTLVPFFYRAKVFTAYEYLERRFDLKTRTLASVLFLCSRGLSCGVIVAAPAVILSIVLGWNLTLTILLIGLPTVLYTMIGGVQAVTWTDVKQMAVIVAGLIAAVTVLIVGLPHDVSVVQALHVAGAAGRTNAIDFRFDWRQTYTFWSGMLGGLFLMLSYFGCDQSQVQRYLTARSIDEGRHSLLMSAYFKIPLQALVLITGVLLFVFYLFNQPPMLFNTEHAKTIQESARRADYEVLDAEFARAFESRRNAAAALAAAADEAGRQAARESFRAASASLKDIRVRAAALVNEVTHDDKFKGTTGDTPAADVNYVFPTFVTTKMPIGLVGLMIAAIFAAAMSSIAAELNSLATATVIDVYRRLLKPAASDAHYLAVSKIATGVWGIIACLVASVAVGLGSLIEVVNRFGSIFYGSLLGVFILALTFRRATGTGAFVGLLAGIATVVVFAFHPNTRGVSYLWHNPLGAAVVLIVGIFVSVLTRSVAPGAERRAESAR